MASDENQPGNDGESPKEAPKKPAAPRRPNPPRRNAPPQHTPTAVKPREDEPTEDDVEDGRFDAIKDKLSQVPKWGWALLAAIVLVVAFFALRPPAADKGDSKDGNFTVTYRQQLTQDGVQAGCFILMEGTRAIGISCVPAK